MHLNGHDPFGNTNKSTKDNNPFKKIDFVEKN